MSQNNNILQELNELQSSLATAGSQNIYTVPSGYFDELADKVLTRIKAMEAENAAGELNLLSPLLHSLSRQMPNSLPEGYFESLEENIIQGVRESGKHQTTKEELAMISPWLNGLTKQIPYTVPAGYFEGFEENIMQAVNESGKHQTTKEELDIISPWLSGLKKQTPYTVPAGYFDNLSVNQEKEIAQPATKVVSMTSRKWLRYAAAAVVTGLIVMAGFMYFNTSKKVDPKEQPYAWVKKSIKKVNSEEIDSFVKLADEELPVQNAVASIPVKKEEIKELMKNVSDKEIQDFLDDAPDSEAEASTDTEIMMN